jgi:hypothetical protein
MLKGLYNGIASGDIAGVQDVAFISRPKRQDLDVDT